MKENQRCLLLVGALHVDEVATLCAGEATLHASNPVHWHYTVGGVATNAAVSAALADQSAYKIALAAAVGSDPNAAALLSALQDTGLQMHLYTLENEPTGRYSAIMDNHGELLLGLADVDLAERLSASHVVQLIHTLKPQAVLIDANLSEECMCRIGKACSKGNVSLAAMAVSPVKTMKLLSLAAQVNLLFCNRLEAAALSGISTNSLNTGNKSAVSIDELADGLLEAGFKQFVLTDGQNDLIVQTSQKRTTLPVPDTQAISSVNGAGDALAGASFAAFANQLSLIDAVRCHGLPQAARVITGEQQPQPVYPHSHNRNS